MKAPFTSPPSSSSLWPKIHPKQYKCTSMSTSLPSLKGYENTHLTRQTGIPRPRFDPSREV